MSRAYVFPGQGAQTIGMGRALAARYPEAQAVFDEVDAALGEPLSALIWEGDIAALTLTANAQPALMATSIAAQRALEAEGIGFDTVGFVAGHSLGEYSALCAAGALSLADTAQLLRLRGRAMQEAVPVGVGAMAAILPQCRLWPLRRQRAKCAKPPMITTRHKLWCQVIWPRLSGQLFWPRRRAPSAP